MQHHISVFATWRQPVVWLRQCNLLFWSYCDRWRPFFSIDHSIDHHGIVLRVSYFIRTILNAFNLLLLSPIQIMHKKVKGWRILLEENNSCNTFFSAQSGSCWSTLLLSRCWARRCQNLQVIIVISGDDDNNHDDDDDYRADKHCDFDYKWRT